MSSAMLTVPNLPQGGPQMFMPPPPPPSTGTTNPVQMSTTWGVDTPPVGSPGNYNFGNSQNPNPSGTPGSTFAGLPTTSMNPGTGGSSTNNFNLNPSDASRLSSELDKYYGQGVGSMLLQFLQSGGGFNGPLTQQAVNAQIQAMQQQIQRGLGNLDTQMGETGVSPNSSAWALETGDYESQAVAQENAITAQEYFDMWNQSQNRMTSILKDVADVNATGTANEPGVFDFLTQGMNAFNTGAGILSNFGVAGFAGF